MAFYTGRNGSIKIGASVVEKVRDWSLETTVELLSTNTIDSGVNTFVPGIKGATGSATLLYYQAGSTNFKSILSKILKTSEISTSDRVQLTLKVDDAGSNSITFNAYITSATVSVSSGELTVVPFNFTVDGEFSTVIS